MSMSLRLTAAFLLAGPVLGLRASRAVAQTRPSVNASAYYRPYGQQMARNYYRINTTMQQPQTAGNLRLQRYAHNVATLGRAYSQVPPWAMGYNPYAPGVVSYGGAYSPGFNPWGVWPAYGNWNPYAGVLNGYANVISASGQYWNDIQQARILREQARREAMRTNRMRVQQEIEYERMRPTALTQRARERTTAIEWARKYAPSTEIWSGRTLNVLLKSAIDSGRIDEGPSIPLDSDTLRGINLKEKASVGNVGLLKNGPKLQWPMSLQEPMFDSARARFAKNLDEVLRQLPRAGGLQRKTYRDLQDDLKKLNEILNENVSNLSTNDWIRGRQYLNQLRDVVRGLSDPRVRVSFDRSWVNKIHSVGGLVRFMKDKGLEFAPAAAAGDNASYSALYLALRSFEMAVNGASLRTR
jgi:hypothetical protein